MNNPVTVSFLPTKEDYINFKIAAAKAAGNKKAEMAFRIIGYCLVLAGFALGIFASGGALQHAVYVVMIACGLILALYRDLLFPVMVRLQAASYFDNNRERMTASTFGFTGDAITLQTDRYHAEIPWELLYRVYEDGRTFVFYTGEGELHPLPKRAISLEENEQIELLLRQKMMEKYDREGVR